MNRLLIRLSVLLVAFSLFACERELLESTQPTSAADLMTKAEINAQVEDHLQTTNTVYNWALSSDKMLQSAVALGDNKAALGYQPAGFENLPERIHQIDVSAGAWKATRNKLVQELLVETERLTGERLTETELLAAPEDGVLPILEINVKHLDLLTTFRNRPEVRYLEPTDYNPEEISLRSDAGCDNSPAGYIWPADYTTTAPSAKIPWNFYFMNIPAAWSVSQGDNIGVALLDTGTSPSQAKLGSQFSSGYSTGRYINRYGTYVSSWWPWASPDGPNDQCGHGTQMAGLIAAPRGYDGSSVGVAYKANLIAYRATGDVVLNGGSEQRGVKDALIAVGGRSDVKIVSMSIGTPFSNGTIADGIYYAYNNGKMIFAAAGTSLTWTSWWGVIFPASMAQTYAVTGVRSGNLFQRCTTCHDGSEVEFTAVMQRSENTDRTSLTLAQSGNQPSYVGGSSAATATTAGIAALVWATNPNQSRYQVYLRMRAAASNYPNRDGNFGWGVVDALQAVN